MHRMLDFIMSRQREKTMSTRNYETGSGCIEGGGSGQPTQPQYQGNVQGQNQNQPKSMPQTQMLLDRVTKLQSLVFALNERSGVLANRLFGPMPEGNEKDKDHAAPNGAISDLHSALSTLENLLAYNHRQLQRLETL